MMIEVLKLVYKELDSDFKVIKKKLRYTKFVVYKRLLLDNNKNILEYVKKMYNKMWSMQFYKYYKKIDKINELFDEYNFEHRIKTK